jgi:hypothetical protein
MINSRADSSSQYDGPRQLVITIRPHLEVRGHGVVHVDRFAVYTGERRLLISRSPFLDSARLLLAEGFEPATWLVMRHHGSSIDALRTTVAAAAKRTVKDTGFGPKFGVWAPFPKEPIAASSAPIDERASGLRAPRAVDRARRRFG